MTPETLAAALLKDVPRWTKINDWEVVGSPLLDEHAVLAALSRAMSDDLAERAGGFVEGLLEETPNHPIDLTLGQWVGMREERPKAADLITALLAQNAALREERDAAVEAKLDAISTLDAWFDRRKLGHEAVDQAIVDAASGYLRTSRVGGMPQEESDLILGVIQDMARLGLFADLFARAALKENSHE